MPGNEVDQMHKLMAVVALVLLCSTLTVAAERKSSDLQELSPVPLGVTGILVGDTLYISGMGGEDTSGKIPRDFEAEVKQSLDNIGAVLKAAEMSAGDVVSVQVYLTDVSTFERMNAVYKTYFKDPRPTRTTVVVAKLVGEGAHRDHGYGEEIGAGLEAAPLLD